MFAQKLKELRKSRNITQERLADIIGVERSSIGKYESSAKPVIPSTDIQIRIADYFNVSLDYLLDRENNISSTPSLTKNEEALLEAYRSHPELQDAVNRILYIGVDAHASVTPKIIDIAEQFKNTNAEQAAAYGESTHTVDKN